MNGDIVLAITMGINTAMSTLFGVALMTKYLTRFKVLVGLIAITVLMVTFIWTMDSISTIYIQFAD